MQLLPDLASEGLICSSDGDLLEGFISNLFIVEHRSGILVVRTALTSVLPGIMQMQVLQACQALQIQLDCTAAKQGDKDLWCEAFLTNTVRGLRPIDKICCLPDNPFGWKPWSCTFVTSPDTSICAKLQRHLDRQDVADVHLV